MATGRLPDPNTAPVTAKGDLYTYSTVPAKLAVGNNGETLVADSSTSTGLRWQGNFAAGKNKVINGDFSIWQRGTSFSTGNGAYVYSADRWAGYFYASNATTMSQQAFTAGSAPVAGYEAQYFMRINSTSNSTYLIQRIEDVRTLAGQTVTLSFWAKSASNQTLASVELGQEFGTGGSAAVYTTLSSVTAVTTSWARYTFTTTLPSISGKTIGTGSNLTIGIRGAINNALDIWGVQLEAGNTATAFQTATGTLAGELAAARRYYVRFGASDGLTTSAYNEYAYGNTTTTTNLRVGINLQQRMRVAPTSVEYANLTTFELNNTERAVSAVTLQSVTNNNTVGSVDVTIATSTNSAMHRLVNNNNTGGYLAFSAEL